MDPTRRATSAVREDNKRAHSRPENRRPAKMTTVAKGATCGRRQGLKTPACRAGWHRYRAGAEHQRSTRKTAGKSTMKLSNLSRRLCRYLRARKAVSALEYAILVGVIAVGIGGALLAFEDQVSEAITDIGDVVGRYARRHVRSGSRRRQRHHRRDHRQLAAIERDSGRWGARPPDAGANAPVDRQERPPSAIPRWCQPVAPFVPTSSSGAPAQRGEGGARSPSPPFRAPGLT